RLSCRPSAGPRGTVDDRTFVGHCWQLDSCHPAKAHAACPWLSHARIEKPRDVVGQFAIVFAVAGLEAHGDGCLNGRRDAPDDLLGELDRDDLTAAIPLRLRDGPAACRDRFCTSS